MSLNKLLRSKLERLARNKTFWRRLPDEFGKTPILLSPDARLQHLKPGRFAFDPDLLKLAIDFVKKDSVVWDVGANVGVFSIAAASLASAGYVLAIEPDPFLVNLINKTKEHNENKELKLEVLGAAVSQCSGIATLAVARRGRASNYLVDFEGRSQAGGARETLIVPILSLDIIFETLPAPTLIKIDVEGAEWAILQGAEKLIDKSHPIIVVEVGSKSCKKTIEYLLSKKYQLSDLYTGCELDPNIFTSSDIVAQPK